MKLKNFKIIMLVTAILQMPMSFAKASEFEQEFKNIGNKIFVQSERVDFYMFASMGLSDATLRQMMDYAKLYDGVIVLRGIEGNSFKKIADHIQNLANDGEEASIIIDPILFKQFQVERVPTYVLAKQEKCPAGISCKPNYDKVTGNITPKYALEKFIEKGDLFKEAKQLLETNK